MSNYKITESTNGYSSLTENSNNSVRRYYVFDESDIRGNCHGATYLDLSVAASRVCDKCKEVDSQSSTENRIIVIDDVIDVIHVNILELKSVHLALLTFTKMF